MFERYLTDALTTNFGHFVENLDADKVRLSAWNGELVLQDLSLRPNALDHLLPDCPVELAYGKVGNLELRIPWSLFRSQLRWKQPGHALRGGYLSTTSPCSVVLSDVNILITPRHRKRRNDDPEQATEDSSRQPAAGESLEQRRINKERQVQSLLDGNLLRRVTESSVSSSRWSWVQDWLSALLSTLSVTVRNIHVRYEDPGTCMGFVWDGNLDGSRSSFHPLENAGGGGVPRSIQRYRPAFAVGITLQQFSVEHDDETSLEEGEKEGEGKDESRSTTAMTTSRYDSNRKVAAAEALAIYWDSDCPLMVIHSERLCNIVAAESKANPLSYSDYYHLAFQALNYQNSDRSPTDSASDVVTTTGKLSEHESLYMQQHSYVLDPISPHVNLNLVALKDGGATSKTDKRHGGSRLESVYSTDDSDESSNDGSVLSSSVHGPQSDFGIPHSSIRIHLPPCKFTLARSMLEDTAYIRKSLSIWKHATKGILSEATLRRLAKLRPDRPPTIDPRGWWLYAAEATIALSLVNREGGHQKTRVSGILLHRSRGWKGFLEAFRKRKRYVTLYQSLVPRAVEEDEDATDHMNPADAHQQLLEMEDELLPDEIVAFRLALYETWQNSPFMQHMKNTPIEEPVAPAAKGGWQLWSSSQEKPNTAVPTPETDILSQGHRVAMIQEMTRALEREQANNRKSAKEESRQASMQSLPTLGEKGSNDDDNLVTTFNNEHAVVWKASVACKEIAIQINEESFDSNRSSNRTTPVVRFSCAWIQDCWWYDDESWDIDCSLASLLVKDLTQLKTKTPHGYFPNLIARKIVTDENVKEADLVWIDGNRHHKGLSISIRRRLHWSSDPVDNLLRDLDRGSTTESRIRILPMEVVYSTVPVEVATRVLGTVKTPELVDDYHRMAAAAHGWQERQKKKFLAALAHKRKKIIVDIDVGAPELLIPEDINRPESPMLAIDLGRLRVFNDEASTGGPMDYDNQWRLVLSDIQVRSSTVAAFGRSLVIDETEQSEIPFPAQRHLVEPFSLEFAVSTSISSDVRQDGAMDTKIRIAATLPRLAFNLNSSSIRLVSRLKNQWQKRRNKQSPSLDVPATLFFPKRPSEAKSTDTSRKKQNDPKTVSHQENSGSRQIYFEFTAPVISLRLDNDMCDIKRLAGDAQGTSLEANIPLLDLSFRGIRGSVVQEHAADGSSSIIFDARLHSLGAIDLFQSAGKDFSLLIASAPPEKLSGLLCEGGTYSWINGKVRKAELFSGEDLVTIQYSSTSGILEDFESSTDKVAIRFHELFVEWNPETFASIQKSISIPDEECYLPALDAQVKEKGSHPDDIFFDAVEEVSFGSNDGDGSWPLVSEVASSSFETAEADLDPSVPTHGSSWSSSAVSMSLENSMSSIAASALAPPKVLYSSVLPISPHQSSYPTNGMDGVSNAKLLADELPSEHRKGFELVFELSKLWVSFNKESRHRKVMIAQMDGTTVLYKTRMLGGSITKMNIGNLVFRDPSASKNATLYSQVLGLKTRNQKVEQSEVSSLLEMEILINPKTKTFRSGIELHSDDPTMPVIVDRERGHAGGCNFFVKARFSPMRFVFLEQLWFEFIDYFFEGIIGNAVWGGGENTDAPPAKAFMQRPQNSPFLPGSDADGLSFTRFDIQLESPELLFPVTYRSPHFLRLELSGINVANRYDGTLIEGDSHGIGPRMQWFNNCKIAMSNLRLFCWNGKELGLDPAVANVDLRWPTGPAAALITPKWRVTCTFDCLDIALRRADYALIQNIISFNIGEPSRHFNEWNALQKLSPADLLLFTESILVHYGYDKKDVTPTTYDLKVTIPSVSARFFDSDDNGSSPVAVARCIDVLWSLRKDSDLVVKQKASFDINLVAPSSPLKMEKLLSSWKYDQDTLLEDFENEKMEEIPELTYTSTTLPSGDNTKTLEIVDACIYANVRAWRDFAGFFSTLPEPALFDEIEIASSIQVGDRWYRIGGADKAHSSRHESHLEEEELSWMTFLSTSYHRTTTQETSEAFESTLQDPTFQFKLSLTSPRIILSAAPGDGIISHLVLRMKHLDLLQVNSGAKRKMTRYFLLDEVEVYTLSSLSKKRAREGENSLIHPWSIGGMIEKCSGQSVGNCGEHLTRISADILKARAAYSDMAVAIEVCLSVAHSAKGEDQPSVGKSISADSVGNSSRSTDFDPESRTSLSKDTERDNFCLCPDFLLFDVECDGFELLVADDSGRHFATNQDLIILSLGKILFSRREKRDRPSKTHLRLDGFDLFDCLQSKDSPFRTAASTRTGTTHMNCNGGNTLVGEKPMQTLKRRKFVWSQCQIKSLGDYKFTSASDLVERLDSTTSQCSSAEELYGKNDNFSSRVVEVACRSTEGSHYYQVKVRSLSVQWNPSTVIAIQRFLGRLRKESKSRFMQVFGSEVDDLLAGKPEAGTESSKPTSVGDLTTDSATIEAKVDLDELNICLNKEHQNRRLLELTLAQCRLELKSSDEGMSLDARVGTLSALDSDRYPEGMRLENRKVVRVIASKGPFQSHPAEFLRLTYWTFKVPLDAVDVDKLPSWVQAHISDVGGIDDFLSLRVAATEFRYLKERTEELIDYLSNGLPGKGMGVTSRAAKGFISKRILTRSFLEFQNDSPQVFVPQNESSLDGIVLKLGDVAVRSYFEKDRSSSLELNESWCRILGLDLSGFQVGVKENELFSAVTSSIDLGINLRKPISKGGELALRGKLSFVDLHLKYSDYTLIRYVTKDNMGKKVNTDKWDNIEKAYWSEEFERENGPALFSSEENSSDSNTVLNSTDNKVAYSSNARFVRYGKAGKRKSKVENGSNTGTKADDQSPSKPRERSGSSIDIKFVLDGLSLKLIRDDIPEGIGDDVLGKAFFYDVILLRVQLVEISITSGESGDATFHLSLFRLSLFDVGDEGRLRRERYYAALSRTSPDSNSKLFQGPRRPCPFYIIAEGYIPDPDSQISDKSKAERDEPQLVVTIDRCPAGTARATGTISDAKLPADSPMTIARVMVNYLSVVVLIRPLKEAAAFFGCIWPMEKHQLKSASQPIGPSIEDAGTSKTASVGSVRSEGLQVKLVAHYPRVFFLADESDSHSRALVLRGLAVINLSKATSVFGENMQRISAVNAQLQSMESYINADVFHALSFKSSHVAVVGEADAHTFPEPVDEFDDSGEISLGVALIQPVTAGIDFCETNRDLFPTKRSVFVNIEPVSTMLSFEDISLIETVLARLSAARTNQGTKGQGDHLLSLSSDSLSTPVPLPKRATDRHFQTTHEVTFQTQRLGLGLKAIDGRTVVTSIQSAEHGRQIELGDVLVSISGDDCRDVSLESVVNRLANSQRPITLQFTRRSSKGGMSDNLTIKTSSHFSPTKKDKVSNAKKIEPFPVTALKLKLKRGKSNGLRLERSLCGGYPVVMEVLPSLSAESFDQHDNESQACNSKNSRIPRPGAIIVGVDDMSIQDVGADEIWAQIARMNETKQSQLVVLASEETYVLSFLEVDSRIWDKVESIAISSSGFSLSFIDDLHGRDMPLFRAKLDALEVHAERGLGGRTEIIEVETPSLLRLDSTVYDGNGSSIKITTEELHDLKSEIVLTLSGIALCSIDYFHPRIAVWEPLVEPSQLFVLLEKQAGSHVSKRPGQTAVELSDRLLREQDFGRNLLQSFGDTVPMVTLNLTDSSAQVTVKAISQWKAWRKAKSSSLDDDSNLEDFVFEDKEIELRESNPLRNEDSQVGTPLNVGKMESKEVIFESTKTEAERGRIVTRRDAKRDAAQKAAQAALVFAQKRGADSSKKGDSAKPFVFRNRTGVSIAFVQGDADSGKVRKSNDVNNLSVVGEYSGLEGFDPFSIYELADQEDAKFSMEMLSESLRRGANSPSSKLPGASNKVRNYEGLFPSLTVAIQAVSGVMIEPLVDLQVFKVGSTVRHLMVQKEAESSNSANHVSTDYSIPVVWKVEIEDNRRVLTLSTAVRVVTTAFDAQMEIGVQKLMNNEPLGKPILQEQSIQSIGFARPESPFYLPLWLALKLEAVNIFVRPRSNQNTNFDWGRSSVLRFAPLLSLNDDDEEIGTWVWEETFEELDYIRCDTPGRNSPIWIAVFSGSASSCTEQLLDAKKRKISTMNYEEEHQEVISVTLDSNVTLRNMLPMSIDWQIAQASNGSASPYIVDGSTSRATAITPLPESFQSNASLTCGECTEVFACNYDSASLQARFREPGGQNWSSWAPLALQEMTEVFDENADDDDDDSSTVPSFFPRTRQVNVQVTNDSFGVPLTFGVRIVPKMTLGSLHEPSKTQIYGIEVIVYAEVWIKNITSLPLNFGCPSYQLHGDGSSPAEIFDETATRFNAESALMEIANLLEVGDKGTGLNSKVARQIAASGSIESLPNQECDELWEEVFEYLEIEFSTVKRRWWASESYDSFRMNITQSNENGRWDWIGDNWCIDTAGDVNSSIGGWESSRNLLAGAGSFNGNRTFDSNHSIRRRRYYRNRTGNKRTSFRYWQPRSINDSRPPGSFHGGLQAFHQPLKDSFSREQRSLTRKNKRRRNGGGAKFDVDAGTTDDSPLKIAIKCADGKWSVPVTIPDTGTSHGVLRTLASRWPTLTTAHWGSNPNLKRADGPESRGMADITSPYKYRPADLSPMLYELCYTVSDVEGEWGEFSRMMVVTPRFMVRNDSSKFFMEVKQAGTPDSSSLKLPPGAVEAFYWQDFRLPGLVCVSPCITTDDGRSVYKWSGGFDICNLGMVPLRIRRELSQDVCPEVPHLMSVRALVEIRPGTGGFGINISFREENREGDGSLFRIENLSPFPVWLSQDGVLANPTKSLGRQSLSSINDAHSNYLEDYEADGDAVRPGEMCAFGLDVPYRQGKYAHRKEATLKELLHVRIALAPLAHRAGIETTKVIGLTTVGECIRMNPSKLFGLLDDQSRTRLQTMRVIAVLCSDGPTRVLKVLLVRIADQDVFGNTFREVSYMASKHSLSTEESFQHSQRATLLAEVKESAAVAFSLFAAGGVSQEEDARKDALYAELAKVADAKRERFAVTEGSDMDHIYSVRAEFSGFLVSLVDSSPSEIAVATLRNFNALARWNALRTNEASLMMSVGWLQVDNHVPSAPFKVAVRPDVSRRSDDDDKKSKSGSTSDDGHDSSPLLMVAIAFAPQHNSGIVCLRSVTIAPRNLVVAIDLAFLVRLQRFFLGLKNHFRAGPTDDTTATGGALLMYADLKRNIPFPHFNTPEEELERVSAFGTENQKLYFQGLTILPAAIKLSVAPARALSPTQAALEGKEVAAIHQAVRKGDILVGSSSALLGVRVGRKNTTPLAVVRGVFKSIVVDALLRLDGASLNFSGVSLRNHISTGPQLTTYLLTHYLASLRQNVPALLGSLAAFGNPLGLIRGLGDGMSDFVSQPVRGLKKSVEELDPTYLVDGVARGTESLARHAVGGFADSASLLTETFSKNMAVLTLDRRYAQNRDRSKQLRLTSATTVTLAGGVESGFVKLVQGFMEGVTGVVKAPMRGAEKKGIEGFAKGVGKGLLGLLVKPMIGISDAATDVMIGVKNSVEQTQGGVQQNLTLDRNQFRPRRPMYGRDRVLRPYKLEDAAAAALMLRTRCAGENYLSHLDLGDRVALFSVKRLILLGPKGQELMALKYKHVANSEVRQIPNEDNTTGWAIIIILNTPRKNGSEVEVLACTSREEAALLCSHIQRGVDLIGNDKTAY